ncbi:metallophosphoesterase family protein [Mucilaginibacter pocheonensis]|uniref:3',5'-cyclic AMP phosphodiesterase CpdA n=1 Tax=Mucilaginibacter pocheonensis TaxID=398050 RepID=A0ABU1TFN2_9SPHI|nr:metallophosphoesterase family protein [Mucilaginibacter pocheonensis]MDR6944230.1 3',5'-cyclic AMP phosphodiesterase CpdA [Mucilaginibacter pocheonensis]
MNKIARRSFIGRSLKMGALLPVIGSPVKLLSGEAETVNYTATEIPDRILLTVTENPAVSITINWRTALTSEVNSVEYTIADAHPEFVSKAKIVNAASKPFSFEEIRFINHRTTLTDLQPDTLYAYRVGYGESRSEWFQFRTAKANIDKAKLSFIYLGDAQVGIKPLWSRVIRKAYATAPDAQLMIHAGDLVNRANKDDEWGDWFAAGNYIHAGMPALMIPGNHEYTHDDGRPHLSVYWNEQFSLPNNGPDDELLKGSCYYTDIQGVRFIALNTQMIEEAPSDDCIKRQVDWLHKVLKQNHQQWTCVVMHHPLYSTKKGRDNKKAREHLKPVFDQYGVDIVLQGHDHAYARGMSKIDPANGDPQATFRTVYVVSVSGSKMYETEPMDWADIIINHTQVYQTINIDGGSLQFKAYLATGEIADAFDLVKRKGKANQLISKK